METPRIRSMREKNALREQLYNQQSRVNAIDKITGFLNQYLTQSEENKRFQAEQDYRQNMLTEEKLRTETQRNYYNRPSAEEEKLRIAKKTWGENWKDDPHAQAYMGATPYQERVPENISKPIFRDSYDKKGNPIILKIDSTTGEHEIIHTGVKGKDSLINASMIQNYIQAVDDNDLKIIETYEKIPGFKEAIGKTNTSKKINSDPLGLNNK